MSNRKEQRAPAAPTTFGAVDAVEKGGLLGEEQPRPAVDGGQLDGRERGRERDLAPGERLDEDDALVRHDVEVEHVLARRRGGGAVEGAEARALEAADAEVERELVDLEALVLDEPAA